MVADVNTGHALRLLMQQFNCGSETMRRIRGMFREKVRGPISLMGEGLELQPVVGKNPGETPLDPRPSATRWLCPFRDVVVATDDGILSLEQYERHLRLVDDLIKFGRPRA